MTGSLILNEIGRKQSFVQINVYGLIEGPFLENGGCRVGGGPLLGNQQGIPIKNFVKVNRGL